jgi:hypothetical protein
MRAATSQMADALEGGLTRARFRDVEAMFQGAMLFSNAIQMLACICLFFLCGLGIVAPLRRQIAFPAASSVFAGALALSSAALTVHVATQMKFSSAVWIAAAGLIGLSAMALRGSAFKTIAGREFVATAAALVVLVGASCFVFLGREIQFSSPALVFFAGSDQFGYAHLADWLNGAPGNVGLAASPTDPWNSWVHYMATLDPRFGSISFVAIVSALTGRSGMFSYNLSCALAMVTASVGLAGIFSRSLTAFIIVTMGVFLSSWFTVSMAGYFGKTIGYPASLFSVGMFFALVRRSLDRDMAPAEFLSVLTVVVSACMAFSAIGTVVILLSTGGMRVAQLAIVGMPRSANRRPNGLGGIPLAMLALAVVGIISGGTVARPMYPPRHPLDDTSWMDLWLRASQVVGPDANLSMVPMQYQSTLALLVGALSAAIALIAARRRNFEALAILSGFTLLASILVMTGKRWEFQLSLTVYVPAILCAFGALSTHSGSIVDRMAAAFATMIIAVGVGRFAATVNATTGAGAYQRFQLSQTEMDGILAAVNSTDGASIDTPDVYSTYPMVLELHRKGIPFQFSPRAWKSFLGYRPWDAPTYSKRYETTITLRDNPAEACGPETLVCTDHYSLQKTVER